MPNRMQITHLQSKKQRLAAFAVIFAVLFQLYLSSAAVLNPTQVHNKNWLSEAQGERVLLCTADGFKWVNINSLVEANKHTSSEFVNSLHLHDDFHFECPLLQAVQFFLLCSIGLLIATIHWLRRIKPSQVLYHFTQCGRLVYRDLAPKHSPPCIVPV